MAIKASVANGNFTAGSTWANCCSGAGANLLTAVAWVTITASDVASPAFTIPNGEVLDGVFLWLRLYNNNLTGILYATLYDGANLIATATLDFSTSGSLVSSNRYEDEVVVFVPFGATITGDGGADYTLKLKANLANKIQATRGTATAGDWFRIFRTTTTGSAPAAGDMFLVSNTVTMDETATTQYGAATAGTYCIVCKGATLQYAYAGSTNYCLRLAASLLVSTHGTLTIGTQANPIPRTSTAVLEFVCATMGQFGLYSFGTVHTEGQSRSANKDIVAALLTADVAINATTASISEDTGWLNGDEIAIAGTNASNGQGELRTLSADAGASSIQWTSGLTYAHTGTSPKQAEVILMTRNVKIRSTSSSYFTWTRQGGTLPRTEFYWTEFRYGGATTVNYAQQDTSSVGGANAMIDMQYCACRDAKYYGCLIRSGYAGSVNYCNNTGYYVAMSGYGVGLGSATAAGMSITDNVMIGPGNLTGGIYATIALPAGTTIARNRISGADYSYYFTADTDLRTFEDNIGHSGYTLIFNATGAVSGLLTNFIGWGGRTGGMLIQQPTNLVVDGGALFGNLIFNLAIATSYNAIFQDMELRGDALQGSPLGVRFGTAAGVYFVDVKFDRCTFGTGTGHTTADIGVNGTVAVPFKDVEFRGCTFSSATFQSGLQAVILPNSEIRVSQSNAAPYYRTVTRKGIVEHNTSIFRTAAPSEKLIPSSYSSASDRFRSTVRRIKVDANGTPTVFAGVYKDASYAGSAPRLVQLANPALDIDSDIVLATMSVGAEEWEVISGEASGGVFDGVLEVCIEVDGAAGAVYVDDWRVE